MASVASAELLHEEERKREEKKQQELAVCNCGHKLVCVQRVFFINAFIKEIAATASQAVASSPIILAGFEDDAGVTYNRQQESESEEEEEKEKEKAKANATEKEK